MEGKHEDKSIVTETGSKGAKIFLLKWGIKIKFFNRYYLRGCTPKNGQMVCNKFDGPLPNPKKNLIYYINLILNKLSYTYYKFFFKK